jgi:hypothetical protein
MSYILGAVFTIVMFVFPGSFGSFVYSKLGRLTNRLSLKMLYFLIAVLSFLVTLLWVLFFITIPYPVFNNFIPQIWVSSYFIRVILFLLLSIFSVVAGIITILKLRDIPRFLGVTALIGAVLQGIFVLLSVMIGDTG